MEIVFPVLLACFCFQKLCGVLFVVEEKQIFAPCTHEKRCVHPGKKLRSCWNYPNPDRKEDYFIPKKGSEMVWQPWDVVIVESNLRAEKCTSVRERCDFRSIKL